VFLPDAGGGKTIQDGAALLLFERYAPTRQTHKQFMNSRPLRAAGLSSRRHSSR